MTAAAGARNLFKVDTGVVCALLQARYYDGSKGEFLSEDPVFLGDPRQQVLTDPQSLNSYSYANDNPITKSDPNGRQADAAFDVMTDITSSAPSWGQSIGSGYSWIAGGVAAAGTYITADMSLRNNGPRWGGTVPTLDPSKMGFGPPPMGFEEWKPNLNGKQPEWMKTVVKLGFGGAALYELGTPAFEAYKRVEERAQIITQINSPSTQTRYQGTQSYNAATGASSNASKIWVTPNGAVITWSGSVVVPAPSSKGQK